MERNYMYLKDPQWLFGMFESLWAQKIKRQKSKQKERCTMDRHTWPGADSICGEDDRCDRCWSPGRSWPHQRRETQQRRPRRRHPEGGTGSCRTDTRYTHSHSSFNFHFYSAAGTNWESGWSAFSTCVNPWIILFTKSRMLSKPTDSQW